MIKYAVLNPTNGEYTFFDTQEEAVNEFYKRMVDFSFPYFHNVKYSVVNTLENGDQEWATPAGAAIENPIEQKQKLEELMNSQ
jgi:hypothetical protein